MAKKNEAGYTLAEILIVLVIIAMIVGLATPALMGRLGGARAKTAEVQLEYLASSLDLYRIDIGRLPDPEAEGLQALVQAPDGFDALWLGPYVRRGELPDDPWNRPYSYERSEDGALQLLSLGRDGAKGGEGLDRDIVLRLDP